MNSRFQGVLVIRFRGEVATEGGVLLRSSVECDCYSVNSVFREAQESEQSTKEGEMGPEVVVREGMEAGQQCVSSEAPES